MMEQTNEKKRSNDTIKQVKLTNKRANKLSWKWTKKKVKYNNKPIKTTQNEWI